MSLIGEHWLTESMTTAGLARAVTIQDLGNFYRANGARARLPSALGKGLILRLDKAQEDLPPAKA